MEIKLDKKIPDGITLSEENFKKLFERSIKLGEDTSGCTTPDDLAGAIPELMSKIVEIETAERLWLSPLISSTILNTAIVEKTDLEKGPGDTISISKVDQLEPVAGGLLGNTHLIEGDETSLSLDYVSFQPVRFGAGLCWNKKSSHATAWDLKATARTLLSQWAASRIEKMIFAALATSNRILFASPATSMLDITPTDTFASGDILNAYVSLLNTSTLPITQLDDFYMLILHPLVYADLMRDSLFVTAISQASQGKTFDLKGFLASYSGCRIAVSPLCPTETSPGSPGCTVYSSFMIGSRAVGIAYEQKQQYLEKISSYGELEGAGVDFFAESKLLRDQNVIVIKSAATPVPA